MFCFSSSEQILFSFERTNLYLGYSTIQYACVNLATHKRTGSTHVMFLIKGYIFFPLTIVNPETKKSKDLIKNKVFRLLSVLSHLGGLNVHYYVPISIGVLPTYGQTGYHRVRKTCQYMYNTVESITLFFFLSCLLTDFPLLLMIAHWVYSYGCVEY